MKSLNEYLESRSIDEAGVSIPSDLVSFYHDLVNCTRRMKTCRNLNDVSKEKDTVEKAYNAYKMLSAKIAKFAALSTMWMDFVDAAWHPVWVSLEDPTALDKKIAAFNGVAKWLVPILSTK